MHTTRIVFSGSGGQGLITAAIILGEAAAIHEGLNAVQTQVYGPEARGGATRADVVISDKPIRYPKVLNPHLLVCLTQEAYHKYAGIVRPGGFLLSESSLVSTAKKIDARQIALPMLAAVREHIGKSVVLNICMLGALAGLTEVVRPESLLAAIKERFPSRFMAQNQEAFELGRKLALELAESYCVRPPNELPLDAPGPSRKALVNEQK
jgi:2-oxoglutarate ferredoxin oxidoreductase subunit gamma